MAFDRSPEVYLDFMRRRGLDANALGRWYDLTEPFLVFKRCLLFTGQIGNFRDKKLITNFDKLNYWFITVCKTRLGILLAKQIPKTTVDCYAKKFKIHKCICYNRLSNLKSEVDIPIGQFDMAMPSQSEMLKLTAQSILLSRYL